MSIENKSGIIPLGFKVLIKIKKLEEKTEGGIYIPKDSLEKESAGSQVATIVDYGQAAFTIGAGDLPKEWDIHPEVGQKVILNRYAGINITGKDDEEYRLVSDKEILAILNEDDDNE